MPCAWMHFMIISTVKEKINWNQEINYCPWKVKAYYLARILSLDIWCLQTKLRLIPLVNFLPDMDESILFLAFMEAPFTTMLLRILFGIEKQVSLGSSETVLGKDSFEQWLWVQACVEISHMHSDNVIFACDKIHLDCDNKHQDKYLSRVGAHYQNARE